MVIDDALIEERGEAGEEIIRVDVDVLAANNRKALEVSRILKSHDIVSINILGNVGSGKTTVIQRLIEKLKPEYGIAVLVGDLCSGIDAKRISQYGVTVRNVNIHGMCHLDAGTVLEHVNELDLKGINILLVENVGSLICPANFSIGSDKTLVVTSVTEGPYTIKKHPAMFRRADVVAINKIDLADAMGVEVGGLEEDCRNANPAAKIVKTNAKIGAGVKELIKALGI